jgi:DHA1 family tetracycline resistance protein-like MFS transporter
MSGSPTPDRAPEAGDRLDFKKVLPVFVIVLIDLLGLTIIIPVLPLYSVRFGADPLVFGLLSAAYPLMQFIGAPLLGRLSDRVGRKPVLIVSQIGTLVGFIILGFANALWLVFLARIVDGISGANISTAQAVITDSTTDKTRTQGLGLIGAAFGLGFVIGPVIAFVALSMSGNTYSVPAFVAAAFSLTSILLTAFWLPETLPAERRGGAQARAGLSPKAIIGALARPGIGILLVLMFAQQLAFGGFESMLALFTLSRFGMDASDNSALFVFAGVILVAVQGYFVGRWARTLGDRKLISLGLLTLSMGLTLTALAPRQSVPWYSKQALEARLSGLSPQEFRTRQLQNTLGIKVTLPDDSNNGWLGIGWLLAAMIPASIGGGLLQPSINSLLTKRIDPAEIGGMLGLSTAFYSAANAITPLVMGALFEILGATAPFLAGGTLLGGLFVAALWLITPGREESAAPGLARGGAR